MKWVYSGSGNRNDAKLGCLGCFLLYTACLIVVVILFLGAKYLL